MSGVKMTANGVAIDVLDRRVELPAELLTVIRQAIAESDAANGTPEDAIEKLSQIEALRSFLLRNGIPLADLGVAITSLVVQLI